MSVINVGIIGFGTVGVGTFEVLTKNREIITNRVGMDVIVKKIADLDIKTDRGVEVHHSLFTKDAMDVIDDPDIDIIVELIGGTTKAKEYILKAIERGKNVVTANKALLAECGKEIFEAAERYGSGLAFEASVGAGIPIIGALKGGLSANRIQTILGILNGTSNFILTKMAKEGLSYSQAVQDAVNLGFAEDPPTLDVDGADAAHKLAVLLSINFGTTAPFEDIYREGIDSLTPDDIRFARELGYSVKLLAIARMLDDRIEARVHPAMIPKNHILANVNSEYNAIYIDGDFVGPNLYYGLGAGKSSTGSAVVADIMDMSRQIRVGLKGFAPPLGHIHPPDKEIMIQPMEELITSYYLKVTALDRPGVLSMISGILGENHIGISSVIQKGRQINGSVPIVMLTHEARESDVQKAVLLLNNLDILTGKTVTIRVEE